ncbi:MAG: hypothetical protein ACOYL1_04765 [Chlamydiia bacterium]
MCRLFYAFLWVLAIYSSIYIGHFSPSWLQKPVKSIDFFCWGDTIEHDPLPTKQASHRTARGV